MKNLYTLLNQMNMVKKANTQPSFNQAMEAVNTYMNKVAPEPTAAPKRKSRKVLSSFVGVES